MAITPERLAQIDSFEAMALFCYEELHWPTEEWNVFEGVPTLYGLSPQDIPGVVSLSAVQKLEASQEWGIFLVDFGGNDLKRPELRKILNAVAQRARQQHDNPTWPHENILFIVRHKSEHWTFGHFRGESFAQVKLRTFGWTDLHEMRTALENIIKLRWSNQKDWIDAWNVEKLTDDFFDELADIFEIAYNSIKLTLSESQKPRLFTQILFNRLLFMRFVEKCGWLKWDERNDYLRALWEVSKEGVTPMWPTRLHALFGAANHPLTNQIHAISKPIIGDVPYLNGGLFESDERFENPNIKIPHEVFERLLGKSGIFYRYNFIVQESSPLDVQVAVDPEILGRIFEKLVIREERHETGSYYTPREIVQFMCREGLINYLIGEGLDSTKARQLITDHSKLGFGDDEAELAFEALKKVTILDPACGSGAYLLGMLQELYALFNVMERRFSKLTEDEAHARKLHIIEHNIYGVDLNNFATNTAMLRLWLTLLVDDRGARPQPLPNLDYKIEIGDSLMGPNPNEAIDLSKANKTEQQGLDFKAVWESADDFLSLREDYQKAHGPEKGELKPKLKESQDQLREKVTGSSVKAEALDWRIEFPDVCLKHEKKLEIGFDIVLANPPYVNSGELLKTYGKPKKVRLVKMFPKSGSGTADLLVFFFDRSLQLLRSGGQLIFITSNKWLIADYGKKLRVLLSLEASIHHLIDFRDLPVFQGTIAYPLITIATKAHRKPDHVAVFTSVPSLNDPFPDVSAVVSTFGAELTGVAFGTEGDWNLESGASANRLSQMKLTGTSLRKYITGKVYRGLVSGLNEAKFGSDGKMYGKKVPKGVRVLRKEGVFVVKTPRRNELIEQDSNSKEVMWNVVTGKEVGRWRLRSSNNWLLYIPWTFDIAKFPAIASHLEQFKSLLENRVEAKEGKHSWYALQRYNSDYINRAAGPKIVYLKLQTQSAFALDESGTLPNDACFSIFGKDLFLLAVLNSAPFRSEINRVCPKIQNGRQLLWAQFGNAIIPTCSPKERNRIEALVTDILKLKDSNQDQLISSIELEINKRVEFLYFHQSEAPTYDEWLIWKESEVGKRVAEIRELLTIGHETNEFECKSSFAWDMNKDEQGDYLKDLVHTAICAMLNSNGGDLLIGVDDDMNVLGLEKDIERFGNMDKLISAIEGPLGDKLKPNPIGLVEIKAVPIEGKTILRVKIKPDNSERYEFKDKIYVRRNAKSKPELSAAEAASWWPKRKAGEV